MHYQLSRRTMLRGLGASMALPWMESRRVWGDIRLDTAKASEAPTRMAILFAGCGFHRHEWWAKGEGRGMELGKVLEPVAVGVRRRTRGEALLRRVLACPRARTRTAGGEVEGGREDQGRRRPGDPCGGNSLLSAHRNLPGLPADQGAAPGHPGSEAGQQHEVTVFEALLLD